MNVYVVENTHMNGVQHVRLLRSQKLSQKLLQCLMQLIYSTVLSLFFDEIPEHIDAFVASWHEFKISVILEIGFFHSPFFHLCVYWNYWNLASSQVLLQHPTLTIVLWGKVKSIWQMVPKSRNDSRATDICQPFSDCAPFSTMLHSCYHITIHLCQLAIDRLGEDVSPIKIESPYSLQHQVSNVFASAHQLIPRIEFDFLLYHQLKVTLMTSATLYRKIRSFSSRRKLQIGGPYILNVRFIYISDMCTNSFSKGIDTLYHTLACSIHISVMRVMCDLVNIL